MAKAVFCIANSESQAEKMVSALKRSGFRDSDISALFPDKTGTKDFAHELHSKAPEGAITGACVVGVVGGCFGWLIGAGTLEASWLQAFAAAGPLIAALGMAALGAVLGGIIGAVIGRSRPEYVARRYRGKIQAGNILLSVHADTFAQARKAKRVFADAGCREATVTTEATVPANTHFCAEAG
jgi:hypothetical protein